MKKRLPPEIIDLPQQVAEVANKGFVVAFNVKGAWPQFYFTNFPAKWENFYIDNSLIYVDPIVLWSMWGEGQKRWSDIMLLRHVAVNDVVMKQASKFGLTYGIILSERMPDKRRRKCFFSAARDDREFTDEEIEYLWSVFRGALRTLALPVKVTDAQLELLELSAQGWTQADLAERRQVTPTAIKKSLATARKAFGARNVTEAVAIAIDRGLIHPFESDMPADNMPDD